MTVYKSTKFEAQYRKLPPELRRRIDASLDKWSTDLGYPSLEWKLVDPVDRWWSIRIGNTGYRAICVEAPDDDEPGLVDYVWFFVGSHDDYIRPLP